jgi:hypothetical protein
MLGGSVDRGGSNGQFVVKVDIPLAGGVTA